MPREARIVVDGQPHHLVLRGNNRRRLFSYASDYLRFLRYVEQALAVPELDCVLHALVLMSNHVHLFVTPADKEALSDWVKHYSQRYSQYRNRARSGSGKLFEERFYSKPIVKDGHLARTIPYIERNATRAGICDHPGDYRWSTYHLHAPDGNPRWAAALEPLWTPSDWYLGLARTDEERSAFYESWYRECDARRLRPEHADEVDALERVSLRYPRRLLRPDGSSAA